MRKTVKAAAVTLAALGTIGLMSTPASADEGVVLIQGTDEKIRVYYNGDWGGTVKFNHHGDIFELWRYQSPGNRIYLEYDEEGGIDWDIRLVGGLEDGVYNSHNEDLPEGTVYEFRGCVQVDDKPDECSGTQHFTA